jgi:hypothetical protein
MPKLVNFLEKSVQWIALGLSSVFLLLCVYWYLLTPPAVKKVVGNVVTPSEIDEMTQNGPVAKISLGIKNNSQTDPINVPDVIAPWKNQMLNPAALPPAVLEPIAVVWGTQAAGRIGEGPNTPKNDALVTAVAALPKATPLSVQAGMSVVAPLPNPDGKAVQGAAAFDVLWASAAFSIPGKDIQAAFAAPLKDKPGQLATFYRTAYLHVELQRQQATGHDGAGTPIFPDGDAGAQTVQIAKVDQLDIQSLPSPSAERNSKAAFAQWAQSNELNIRQPKFYTIQAGSIWQTPVLPGQAGAPAAGAAAAPRPVMAAPAANPGGANANNGKEVGIDPLKLTDDQLVWAHDDTVEPGRSYRYRIVYHMMNPVFALVNIADPKILDQLDIPSPPSDWSTPVTIPLNVQYWVKSLQHGGAAALIDVFKWELGNWKQVTLSLAPGDTVPGTDQTLVDVHISSSQRPRDQYVLLTDASGEAIRHVPNDDRSNATYKDLLGKTNPANPAAGGAPPPQPRNAAAGRPGLR